MIEKRKHFLDNGYTTGVLFMGLSKAFDVLNHFLLLARLDAYEFSLKSTSFIQSEIKGYKKSMSIINSVGGKIFIMVCQRAQYLANSSSIFSLMIFSAS